MLPFIKFSAPTKAFKYRKMWQCFPVKFEQTSSVSEKFPVLWHRKVYSQCVLLNKVFTKRQKLLGSFGCWNSFAHLTIFKGGSSCVSHSTSSVDEKTKKWNCDGTSLSTLVIAKFDSRTVSDFTYLLSGYLSGYAILKIPFSWFFFPKSIDVVARTVPFPSRSFGYRPRRTCSGCWTVLAAIWFNIKLVSSVGSRFFRLLTVPINNYFFILCASPGLRSLEIIECKLGTDQNLQVSFAHLTEV